MNYAGSAEKTTMIDQSELEDALNRVRSLLLELQIAARLEIELVNDGTDQLDVALIGHHDTGSVRVEIGLMPGQITRQAWHEAPLR